MPQLLTPNIMLTFHVITIFPSMFDSYLSESILKRAIAAKKIAVKFYNPRDFTTDKHGKVDDKPYGGGPGMVMSVQPIVAAAKKAVGRKKDVTIIMTVAGGKEFTNTVAQKLATKNKHIVIICGRYEGIDARVKKILRADGYSIGDYVLTGGELPAMVMIDGIARQLPGVLGKQESIEENRIASHEMYTRPEVVEYGGKEYTVPKVLTSGDHAKIDKWRSQRS